MKDLINDSLRLLSKIESDTFEPFPMVHIAQNNYLVFSFPTQPKVPTGYGYVVDRTPLFLEQEGLIKILDKGRYVVEGFRNRLLMNAERLKYEALDLARILAAYERFTGRKFDFEGYSFVYPGNEHLDTASTKNLRFVVVDRKKIGEWKKRYLQRDAGQSNNEKTESTMATSQRNGVTWQNGELKIPNRVTCTFHNSPVSEPLFDIFMSEWFSKGKKLINLPKPEIITRFKKFGGRALTDNQVSSMISNIRKSLNKYDVNDCVKLDWNKGGWNFDIDC